MRRALLLLPLLAAACASPQEQCISQVTRDLRVIGGLVNETQGNLARGYAIQQVSEEQVVRRTCTGKNEDGSTFTFPGDNTTTVTRDVPVAIDLNAEQAKLNSLLERQSQLERSSQAAIQQCAVAYPE